MPQNSYSGQKDCFLWKSITFQRCWPNPQVKGDCVKFVNFSIYIVQVQTVFYVLKNFLSVVVNDNWVSPESGCSVDKYAPSSKQRMTDQDILAAGMASNKACNSVTYVNAVLRFEVYNITF